MGFGYATNNCCFLISLKTGSLIILWLYLLSGISWMLSPTISGDYKRNVTIEVATVTSSPDAELIKYTANGAISNGTASISGVYSSSYDGIQALLKEAASIFDLFSTPYYGLGWSCAIFGSITVVIAVLGLYGVYKENPSFLKPYLVWELIDIIIIWIVFTVNVITVHINLGAALYICISSYFWLVIYSHHKFMSSPLPTMMTD